MHYIEYLGWRLITGLLKLIPRRGIIVFADAAGWMLYHVLRVRRDVIDSQLRLAFASEKSPEELAAIGLKSWQNAVLTFFEFIQPNPIGSEGWDRFHAKEGDEEYCQPLIRGGEGVLVLTGHIGNWEALGGLARREGVKMVAVAKPMHNDLVNESILESRRRRGLEVIQLKTSMKGIIDAARQGKWIAIVGDQDARRRGVFVNFFGRPASTAPGIAHLSHLLDLPVLPGFCVRIKDADRHLKVIYAPPIYPDKSADREADILRITQEHTAALEAVIRRHPEDYFWLHRRWKTQPKRAKAAEQTGAA
jgi:KDO2-lipid IV(A) lauroyltransferase